MSIKDNVLEIRERISNAARKSDNPTRSVYLVAAAKTASPNAVRQAIDAGVDAIGENRFQELAVKLSEGAYEGAPLHFLGRLQKNKVSKLTGVCELIQSVDSKELLELIGKKAHSQGFRQDVLLEVNIAREPSKGGFAPDMLIRFLDESPISDGICVRGLMSIPPIPDKNGNNRVFFEPMYKLFVDIAAKKYDNVCMDFLSMGMSADYLDAIAEGSNMVRVGSAIFGERS